MLSGFNGKRGHQFFKLTLLFRFWIRVSPELSMRQSQIQKQSMSKRHSKMISHRRELGV